MMLGGKTTVLACAAGVLVAACASDADVALPRAHADAAELLIRYPAAAPLVAEIAGRPVWSPETRAWKLESSTPRSARAPAGLGRWRTVEHRVTARVLDDGAGTVELSVS